MRKTRRVVLGGIGVLALGLLAGCKPDIPLVPFIKSDVMPYSDMQEVGPISPEALGSVTHPDRSPQATQAPSHTAHAAAPQLP